MNIYHKYRSEKLTKKNAKTKYHLAMYKIHIRSPCNNDPASTATVAYLGLYQTSMKERFAKIAPSLIPEILNLLI